MTRLDQILYLYGGDHPWDANDWVAVDDRVRGGSSRSHLEVTDRRTGRFWGHLDTSTLGGAGFASQRSRGPMSLDLGAYDGVIVAIAGPAAGDGKRYVLTLMDTEPGRGADGRERAGVSWQAEFVASAPGDVRLAWADFKPTFRGRPKKDAEPLDRRNIRRVSIMMRSFFDSQKGDFSLELHGIAAYKGDAKLDRSAASDQYQHEHQHRHHGRAVEYESEDDEDPKAGVLAAKELPPRQARRSWWRGMACGLL